MIRFLLKGLWRDRSRSLFPFIAVAVGVLLTVVLQTWLEGILDGFFRDSAAYDTGHLKVTTRAYRDEADQLPNDLALLGTGRFIEELKRDHSGYDWRPRIKFGGLLDVPDATGETRAQGPVAGFAADILGSGSPEPKTLRLETALVRGRIPRERGEILISDEFAGRLGVGPGDKATLIGATMHGAMSLENFAIAGTVKFGIAPLDRGAIIADIADVRAALDMDDAAGEILGYFPDGLYRREKAEAAAAAFNAKYAGGGDEFAPVMVALTQQGGLIEMLDTYRPFGFVIYAIFIAAMSLVLWNAGLIGGLRRYGEMGVRLAVGEAKSHVYRTLVGEALLTGFFGTIAGTIAGLGIAYFLQTKGVNFEAITRGSSLMMSSVMKARITPETYFVGFIPGLLATAIGSAISGLGIFKRRTAQLFKELEV
jgi:putative ABC transport system permease protein